MCRANIEVMARIFSPAFRLFLKDRWIRLTFVPAFIASVLTLVLLFKFFPRADNTVLHYNVYFGIDLLGPWYNVFFLPLIGIGLTLINAVMAASIWRWDRIASYLLAIGAMVVVAVTTGAAGLLLYLNV